MQAEVEAQQARTLINDVVANLMRVRQLQEHDMLTQSEGLTEKKKAIADLQEARQHSLKALVFDTSNKRRASSRCGRSFTWANTRRLKAPAWPPCNAFPAMPTWWRCNKRFKRN